MVRAGSIDGLLTTDAVGAGVTATAEAVAVTDGIGALPLVDVVGASSPFGLEAQPVQPQRATSMSPAMHFIAGRVNRRYGWV